jgi:hypothetical protein
LLVLVPLLLLFAAGFAFFVVEIVGLVAEPIDVTNDYLADVRAGRYEEAYARTCTYAGAAPTLEEFVNEQRQLDQQYGRLTAYDITGSTLTSSGARSEGTWVRGGREYDVAFQLREEGDEWKVCGLVRSTLG